MIFVELNKLVREESSQEYLNLVCAKNELVK